MPMEAYHFDEISCSKFQMNLESKSYFRGGYSNDNTWMEPQSSGILHTNLRTSQLGQPRISGAHLASRDAPRTSGLRPSVLGASLDARCAPSMLCRSPHGASPLGASSLLGSFGLYVKSLTFRHHSCIVTLSPGRADFTIREWAALNP